MSSCLPEFPPGVQVLRRIRLGLCAGPIDRLSPGLATRMAGRRPEGSCFKLAGSREQNKSVACVLGA